jgi:hypothetical protein
MFLAMEEAELDRLEWLERSSLAEVVDLGFNDGPGVGGIV